MKMLWYMSQTYLVTKIVNFNNFNNLHQEQLIKLIKLSIKNYFKELLQLFASKIKHTN